MNCAGEWSCLKPLLPILLDALERHGHLCLAAEHRRQLLAVSAATIDRLLAPTRAAVRERSRRRAAARAVVRRRVPIRTFADWKNPLPGYMEADLVAHGGASATGSFVHTLTLTDIASGWTECLALVVREGALVREALTQVRAWLPFPLLGFDTDNGSEFINEIVIAYCQEHGIEFTRARPYRKNDQAWVEQKNGAVVRRLVGYHRFEGLAAAAVLSQLYTVARLFVNFFQPSFKLRSKTRVGARVTKKYYPPETPCARLLASETVPESIKAKLRAVAASLDPIHLLDEIRARQHQLTALASGGTPPVLPPRDLGLERFLKSLATSWQAGEVRPTHQPRPRPPRHWRTRTDPFEAAWPTLRGWLEAEPERTAKELLERLQREEPGKFSAGQLRTLQRRVKEWRLKAAQRLLSAELSPRAPVTRVAGVEVLTPDRGPGWPENPVGKVTSSHGALSSNDETFLPTLGNISP